MDTLRHCVWWWCKDTGRRWPSTSHGERPGQIPASCPSEGINTAHTFISDLVPPEPRDGTSLCLKPTYYVVSCFVTLANWCSVHNTYLGGVDSWSECHVALKIVPFPEKSCIIVVNSQIQRYSTIRTHWCSWPPPKWLRCIMPQGPSVATYVKLSLKLFLLSSLKQIQKDL